MLTNIIGNLIVILSTNHIRTDFLPIACGYCTNVHHYSAVEQYEVLATNFVDVMFEEQMRTIAGKVNIIFHVAKTNYIEHPSIYRVPGKLYNFDSKIITPILPSPRFQLTAVPHFHTNYGSRPGRFHVEDSPIPPIPPVHYPDAGRRSTQSKLPSDKELVIPYRNSALEPIVSQPNK